MPIAGVRIQKLACTLSYSIQYFILVIRGLPTVDTFLVDLLEEYHVPGLYCQALKYCCWKHWQYEQNLGPKRKG